MKLAEKTGTTTGYWFCEVTIQGDWGGRNNDLIACKNEIYCWPLYIFLDLSANVLPETGHEVGS